MPSSLQHPEAVAADRDAFLAQYAVHSRTEILFLLRAMQRRKILVNLDLPNSRQIIVTSIVGIDEAEDALILDSARGDALNHELLSGKGAEFIAQLDGVSITFSTGPVSLIDYQNLPSLRIGLPKSLIRLQRREYFRVQMPIAHPVKCIVPPVSDDDPDPITTHIVDLGCGGVAIVESGGRLGTETGRLLEGCTLSLPDMEPITATLEVRSSAQIRRPNGAFQTRLGCKFIALPSDTLNMLQRFVTEYERARRNGL